MNEHEEKFVKSFIAKNRRERYLTKLASKKGRKAITDRLAHNLDFEMKYAYQLQASQHSVKVLEALLKEKGAKGSCYVLSENSKIDGKELLLSEALNEVVGYTMGTVISCIPGILAYYESEDVGECYILFKKKTN